MVWGDGRTEVSGSGETSSIEPVDPDAVALVVHGFTQPRFEANVLDGIAHHLEDRLLDSASYPLADLRDLPQPALTVTVGRVDVVGDQ